MARSSCGLGRGQENGMAEGLSLGITQSAGAAVRRIEPGWVSGLAALLRTYLVNVPSDELPSPING